MSKKLLIVLLAIQLPFIPALRTEEASAPQPTPEEAAPSPSPAPREVGKAAEEGAETSRQSNLGTITIAFLAVATAATAIILVSRHQGKHHGG